MATKTIPMPSHINVSAVYELMQSLFLLSMVDFLWIDGHTVGLLAAPYPINNAIYCMLIRMKKTLIGTPGMSMH